VSIEIIDGNSVVKCPHCGQPLVELLWSKSETGQRMYILTCENIECPRYRNPVKAITKEAVK